MRTLSLRKKRNFCGKVERFKKEKIMNIVALSNRLASKVPHWHELEKLSKEDKIEVIALLSMSIANAEEIKTPTDRTKEMVERCCGSWVGDQSAEDIIANINESKMSKSEPVKFAY